MRVGHSPLYYYYELLVVPWDKFERINICELPLARKITILNISLYSSIGEVCDQCMQVHFICCSIHNIFPAWFGDVNASSICRLSASSY